MKRYALALLLCAAALSQSSRDLYIIPSVQSADNWVDRFWLNLEGTFRRAALVVISVVETPPSTGAIRKDRLAAADKCKEAKAECSLLEIHKDGRLVAELDLYGKWHTYGKPEDVADAVWAGMKSPRGQEYINALSNK